MKRKIYMDYAAATPMSEPVLAAMRPYFTDNFHNPSALYIDSRRVAEAVAEARGIVAGWVGARLGEVIFTAGGTEANNLAVQGIMNRFPGSNMLISAIEHESILQPSKGYDFRETGVNADGIADLNDLAGKLNDNTVLVSVIYANNEIGTIQPLAQIAGIIDGVRKKRRQSGNKLPLYLHTDACQAANLLTLQTARLGVDMMTLNGGKIYGPKQSGALYVSSRVELDPLLLGGGQERGYRSGTENVPSIIGFAAALDNAQARRHTESRRLAGLQQLFLDQLTVKIPGAVINGSLKMRLANNINVSLPKKDNERLVMALDEKGVQCASGSACSAIRGEPSHVLRAVGIDDETARGSLRFTMGTETDETEVKTAVDLLAEIVA